MMVKNDVYNLSGLFLVSVLGLCAAVFPIASLAANPPVRYDPVTTTYYTTPEFLKKPAGARTYTRDVTPLIEHWDDGLRQRMGGGVTIEAQRVRAPFTAYVRATGSALKTAAYRCFTSLRCNAALVAASYGLDALLDAVDWVIDEGGKVQRKLEGTYSKEYSGDYDKSTNASTCMGVGCENENFFLLYSVAYVGTYYCSIRPDIRTYFVGANGRTCYYKYEPYEPETIYEDVSPVELQQEIENNYQPDITDWPALAESLQINDLTYSVDPIPTQTEEPTVSTDYDASGNPTGSIERSREHDFEILNNGSSNPELQVNTKEIIKRYEDGQLVSSTETEESLVPEESIPPPQQPPVELPEGCALFDPFCQWAKWTQEPLDEPEPDLTVLIDEFDPDIEEYDLSFGAATCPAPIDIELGFYNKTIQLSYEPVCDVLTTIRPLIIASAYLFAAFIYLGVFRRV